jgi:CoA:oxalate CoA-transferase
VMRLQNKPELTEILQAEIGKRKRDGLYQALVEAEVPAAPINRIDAALADEQVWHREMVVRVPHRAGDEFHMVASPIKSEKAGDPFQSPPGLGDQTREILHRLGYSPEDVENMLRQGVIGTAP